MARRSVDKRPLSTTRAKRRGCICQTEVVMLLQFSLAALLMQAAPTAVEPHLAGSSRPTPTDIAGFAVLRFLSTWRSAWLQGSDLYGFGHTDTRLRDVHCH